MSYAELKTDAIDETRRYVFARAGWACEVCGAPLSAGSAQLAHRIPQNTRNLTRYGKRVIHHPDNMAATCSLKCNAAVSIGGKPLAIAALVAQIRAKLGEV